MPVKFYKYHGAGNDFLLADNRDGSIVLSESLIRSLCHRHTGFGADGIMLLENCPGKDFRMVYYNPDGSGGMMCGNGGRCIVSFAADMGVAGTSGKVMFEAPDGEHQAEFIDGDFGKGVRQVRLKMKDVSGLKIFPEEHSCFLDTGTRHLVKFVEELHDFPVLTEGPAIRYDPRFAPLGTNVNFVEPEGKGLLIRTYEKGVEGETLACGTGIVAAALAAYSQNLAGTKGDDGRARVEVKASIATLEVDFIPEGAGESFRATDVWLTGPAAFVGTVIADI